LGKLPKFSVHAFAAQALPGWYVWKNVAAKYDNICGGHLIVDFSWTLFSSRNGTALVEIELI
jgi:hypothetical protein